MAGHEWALTVNMAMQTVARMNPFEDRKFRSQGLFEAPSAARSVTYAMIQSLSRQ